MEIGYRELTFPSSEKGQSIFARIYTPQNENDVRGVVQVVHGMAEHSALYDGFCRFLAQNGFAVGINDHLGHGESVKSGDDYGYFGAGGLNSVVLDLRSFTMLLQKEFAHKPVCIMGHSMGSFLAREYCARYGDTLACAVFMGTSRGLSAPVWAAEKLILRSAIRRSGPRGRDERISSLATGAYNKPFKPCRTPFDWVSSDPQEVDRYNADPLCGFSFTLSGYYELGALLQRINRPQWYALLPRTLPVLLISGQADPVGEMGRGVGQVYDRLRSTGHDAQIILYPQIRHALVTEVNREQVFADILSFLLKHVPPQG